MKTKIYFLAIALLFSTIIYSQDNGWRFLNHESGGYVTSIIPIKYSSGQQPSSLSGQVLYARTDVGGIYRSGNNGLRWDFNSCYYRTPPGRNFAEVTASEFHIQGLAVRFNNRDGSGVEHDAVVVATGHYFEDAQGISFKTIWRSNDNGNTGTFTEAVFDNGPKIWFKGNDFLVKIGGECIIYDPNNINGENSYMYAGGFNPTSNGASFLYKSFNDGQNWSTVSSWPGISNEGIICISMKAGSNHIWVGTTHRIVFSTDNGATWNTRNIGSISTPYVKRIIFPPLQVFPLSG